MRHFLLFSWLMTIGGNRNKEKVTMTKFKSAIDHYIEVYGFQVI